MKYEADIVIIGAGVIGLAIAAQVSSQDRAVYVLERNKTFGLEISSRQSEVIHAGIYYPGGSLKARACVEGNAALYQLCDQYGIGCKKLGKLIVATAQDELDELDRLREQGIRNGVTGLKMLSKSAVDEMEPNVMAIATLYSPSTGIIDSHALMSFYLAKATENGANVAYKSEVTGIEELSDGYRVTVKEEAGTFPFTTKVVINCAGLSSDEVAEMAGIDIIEAGYKLHYCKGQYFSVGNGKNRLVNRLIYPTPQPKDAGLGVHVTLDLEGRMRLGPDTHYIDQIDYSVDERQKTVFYQSAKQFLPFIEYDDLEPEMAGVRPKLQGPGDDFRDFVIEHEAERGLPGFINLIGIESPGLTSSPAIARIVADMIDKVL